VRSAFSTYTKELNSIAEKKKNAMEELTSVRNNLDDAKTELKKEVIITGKVISDRDQAEQELEEILSTKKSISNDIGELKVFFNKKKDEYSNTIEQLKADISYLEDKKKNLNTDIDAIKESKKKAVKSMEENLDQKLKCQKEKLNQEQKLYAVNDAVKEAEAKKSKLESELLDIRQELKESQDAIDKNQDWSQYLRNKEEFLVMQFNAMGVQYKQYKDRN
jgi:chromosome segregation ATPase